MSKPPKAPGTGPRSGLSEVTADWLAAGDPGQRKSLGQFMTPRPVADALLDRIELKPGMRVLDPGVGTGELLRAVLDREPAVLANGWDVDEGALNAARELVPEARLEQRSALDVKEEGQRFDLVIGNPPYFQLRLDPAERDRFGGVISGRPNIFALFFQVGLQQLRPGGILAYIVPPSMNSGAYFESLREYLTGHGEILDLTILEGTGIFEGANTAIQLLVLKKTGSATAPQKAVGRISATGDEKRIHRRFAFEREVAEAGFRRVLFTPDPGRLAAEFEGRRTLWELGLEAATGQVIWNENRDRLTGRPGPGLVPLIWSHTIGEGELRSGEAARDGKPGYYDTRDGGRQPLEGPAIVVNRVVGAVGRGELRAALVPVGEAFLAENHVNVIRPRRAAKRGGSKNTQGWSQSGPPGSGAIDWEGVLASLRAPGVAERVRLLTGNTQISARELTHLLPLD